MFSSNATQTLHSPRKTDEKKEEEKERASTNDGSSSGSDSENDGSKKDKKHRHGRQRHHMKERRERKEKEREEKDEKKKRKREDKMRDKALKADVEDDDKESGFIPAALKVPKDLKNNVEKLGVDILSEKVDVPEKEGEDDDDWGGEHSWVFEKPVSQFIFTGAMYRKDENREEETSFNRRFVKHLNKKYPHMLAGTADIPIFNLRDLADATPPDSEICLARRRIYRSACISRGGVTSSEAGSIINYIRDNLGIHTIIDFRNKKERNNDPHDKLIEAYYPTVVEGKTFLPRQPKRYRIKLMNQQFKIVGLFITGSNTRTKMEMLKAAITPKSAKTPSQVFTESALNGMGLFGLNKLMLQFGAHEIVAVLRVCADFENYPILYHCSSGKDRTGLISMFLLSICGLSENQIIDNYALSETFLKPTGHLIAAENQLIGLVGFDGTPPQVMRDTLDYIRLKWGGPATYLSNSGFNDNEQADLRKLLLGIASENEGAAHKNLKQSIPIFASGRPAAHDKKEKEKD